MAAVIGVEGDRVTHPVRDEGVEAEGREKRGLRIGQPGAPHDEAVTDPIGGFGDPRLAVVGVGDWHPGVLGDRIDRPPDSRVLRGGDRVGDLVVPARRHHEAGVEARVGSECERPGRPGSSASPDELTHEALGSAPRARTALSEAEVEDLSGLSPGREQRVVAEDLRVAEGGTGLVVTVDRANRRIHVDGHRLVTRSRAERPGTGDQQLGNLVELADVSEGEASQERPERRRCHHPMSEHLAGRSRAEHVRIVDERGARDHGVHERRNAPPRERSDVDQLLGERFEAEFLREHRHQSEPRIGHRVVIVEGHRQTRSTAR